MLIAHRTGLPDAVPFTVADSVQPILANRRIFVGSLEGPTNGDRIPIDHGHLANL